MKLPALWVEIWGVTYSLRLTLAAAVMAWLSFYTCVGLGLIFAISYAVADAVANDKVESYRLKQQKSTTKLLEVSNG